MKTEQDYWNVHNELRALSEANDGAYITDPCVDSQNAVSAYGTDEFWGLMIRCAIEAAIMRTEEAGISLPKHFKGYLTS